MDHRNVDADFFKPKVEAFEAVKAADFPDGMAKIFILASPQFHLSYHSPANLFVVPHIDL